MASHSQLLLAFVCAVYFFACVNCFYWPQVPVAGGWNDMYVNNKNIQELVKEIPYNVPGFADLEIVKVVRARYQVVSGFKYALEIQTRPKVSMGQATQECTITIWVQPWLRRRVLLGRNCQPIKQNSQPPLLGGWREGQIDMDVRNAANFAMSEINRQCNCYYMKLIYNINSVQQQVVAGIMYKINVNLIETLCRNMETNLGKNWQECGINPSGHAIQGVRYYSAQSTLETDEIKASKTQLSLEMRMCESTS